jgi:class 3 adenylate cyclase/tetratricopeptide (TPR) repeat protein
VNCPNCQHANPDGAKFCLNCGQALALTCPRCGAGLPAGSRFCSNCGYQLAGQPQPVAAPASAPPATGDPLLRFIPRELATRLEAARHSHAMEGERRNVTILFCDVKGSTAMAEQLDPEEWADIMNRAFEHLISPVYRYEGTVARLMGDAILAFFGAPIAHEDDPQRAVLAGLGIVEGIGPYREQMQRDYGLDFNVRVGINTGLVVVGAVGSDLRLEYTAMGDAVNLAARMEQTAEPGTVQISQYTYRTLAPLFEVEDLGGIAVKGKAEPVQAYRVLRPKAQPGRQRGIAGLESPLVGREAEMRTLQAAVAQLLEGRGQIVCVMGEAGLGKSRLIAELRQTAHDGAPMLQRVKWVEARSLSFQAATPYAAFIDLFSRWFDLRADQPDADRFERLRSALDEMLPEKAEGLAPFIGMLLGLQLSGEALERVRYLEPLQLRGRLFTAVADLIEGAAGAGPLVLAFDDAHWMDPSSLELLTSLLPLAERAPLMALALFRPSQQEPGWHLHETALRDHQPRYTPITLKALDEGDSRQLVAHLLHIEDLPERVRSLILQKAEGNPFFVEEVIRSLLDARLVVRADGSHWRATREIDSIAVPDTIAGVITARLDRLDDSSRRAAQTAAVIGREFALEVLADVHEAPEELDQALAELQRRELVLENNRRAAPSYVFKHVLTQETVYASILMRQRRDLHRRVAESLERSAPDLDAEIARHFVEARDTGRALPYLLTAADRAARAYSTREAIGQYERALEILKTIDDPVLTRRAHEGLGNAFELANDNLRALEVYTAMLGYARAHADISMQISALNKLSSVYAMRLGRFADAEESLKESERLAREASDNPGLSELFLVRCRLCTATADFEGVIRYMSDGLKLGRQIGNREKLATGSAHMAQTLAFMTRFDEARAAATESLALCREVGDRRTEAEVLAMTLSLCHLNNGDLEEARRCALEGVLIGEPIGSLYATVYGLWALGKVALLRGQYEQALDYLQRSLAASLPTEQFMPFLTVQPLGGLGSAYLEISDQFFDRAAEHHQHALKLLEHPAGTFGGGTAWADIGFCALAAGNLPMAAETFDKGLGNPTMFMFLEKARFLAGSALLALAQGRADEAAGLAEQARTFAEEHGTRQYIPLIEFVAGEAAVVLGDLDGALQTFAVAEARASAMQMRPILWQAQASAARVLWQRERPGEARAKLEAARATIDEIAALFGDVELRRLFADTAAAKVDAALAQMAVEPKPAA